MKDILDVLLQIAQLVLALFILVGLHEAGHMIAAKMFGMRVEKFFIGFAPKLFSFKKGETEYGLGLIPFGGFVKISGMVDESLDTEALKSEPQPWEFRSKPAWQRLIVMLGGIIVNVILGVFLFILVALVNGKSVVPMSEVNKTGIVSYELGNKFGFKTGDKILKVKGKTVTDFQEVLSMEVFSSDNPYYTVERNGKVFDLKLPKDFINIMGKNAKSRHPKEFIDIPRTFEIFETIEGSEARKIGLQPGDRIIDVHSNQIRYFHDLQDVLKKNKNKLVTLKIDRKGEIIDLKAKIDTAGKLGFFPKFNFKVTNESYSFTEGVQVGFEKAFGFIFIQNKVFAKMFQGDVDPRNSVGSIFSMLNIFPKIWDTMHFFAIVATFSMMLAFMNLLPIPALDGGHVVFTLWEMVTGKKPGDKFLENAQKVGMVILLTLMVFALTNDIANFGWVKDLFGIKD